MRNEGNASSHPNMIHVVFATDANYIQHLAVTIASIVSNNTNAQLHFHIVFRSVADTDQKRLGDFLHDRANIITSFYEFDAEQFDGFPVSGHINIVSYFRLFLTEILPSNVMRVIYLDSDLVIESSIVDLYNYDLCGHAIGAVIDPFNEDFQERLNGPVNHKYFNAGVLVIDLNQWRYRQITALFVEYVNTNSRFLRFHDQDVLNIIFANDVEYLPYKWNFQARTKPRDLRQFILNPDIIAATCKNPYIIHFTTNRKPWFYKDDVAFEDRYMKYLSDTPWCGFTPSDKTKSAILFRNIKRKVPLLFKISKAIGWRLKARAKSTRLGRDKL